MSTFERRNTGAASHFAKSNTSSHSSSQVEKCDASPALSYIAGLTARDHGIKVFMGAEGSGSFARLDAKEITLDPTHCETEATARFVAAHEGAHIGETLSLRQLGRSEQQIKEYVRKIGLPSLSNVLEDGAINDRFCRQYQNLRADTLESYPRVDPSKPGGLLNLEEVQQVAIMLGRVPRFAEALAGLLNDWSELRHELGFSRSLSEYQAQPRRGSATTDPEVQEFFNLVLNEARRIISMIPGADAPASESYTCSKERHIWVETVVYPELKKLVDSDLKDLEKVLQNMPAGGHEVDGEGSGDAKNTTTPTEARRRARKVLAELDDAIRESLESLKDKAEKPLPTTSEVIGEQNEEERQAEAAREAARQAAVSAEQLKKALLASLTPYHQEYREIAAMLDEAYNRLMDIFDPVRHFKWRSDVASGSRLNMTQAMRFELTGEGHERVWMQRIEPQYPNLAVTIVLDRSGSMDDGVKCVEARRAMIFAKELFNRLNIPTACTWFADSSEVILTFEDDIRDSTVQERFMAETIPLSEGTNDAVGIETAAAIVREDPATRKVIVVLSDAQSGSGDELRKVIRDLAEKDVPVLHFGLGPGTADTSGYYIHSWGDLKLQGRGSDGFLSVFCREMERLAQGALEG